MTPAQTPPFPIENFLVTVLLSTKTLNLNP